MKNKICSGKTIEWYNGTTSTVVSGEPVLVGGILGVAVTDIAEGESGVLELEGVFELAQEAVAFNKFDKVYFIAASKTLTNVDTGNTHVGFAYAGTSSGDAVVQVKINALAA